MSCVGQVVEKIESFQLLAESMVSTDLCYGVVQAAPNGRILRYSKVQEFNFISILRRIYVSKIIMAKQSWGDHPRVRPAVSQTVMCH